jgi:hypothetical protein
MSADVPVGFPFGPVSIVAMIFVAIGCILLIAGLVALFRMHPMRSLMRMASGALLIALGAVAGSLAAGVQGYQALTAETLAARIEVRPLGPQRFEATLRMNGGQTLTREFAGDEIYIDAHILKWKPVGNIVGLQTLWSLDRVAGRYRSVEQERSAPRTLYPIAPERMVDLFELRRRYGALAPLYDAEYGSASFLPVTGPAELELKVTNSGLLLRALPPTQAPRSGRAGQAAPTRVGIDRAAPAPAPAGAPAGGAALAPPAPGSPVAPR